MKLDAKSPPWMSWKELRSLHALALPDVMTHTRLKGRVFPQGKREGTSATFGLSAICKKPGHYPSQCYKKMCNCQCHLNEGKL